MNTFSRSVCQGEIHNHVKFFDETNAMENAQDSDHASLLLTEALNAAYNAPDIRQDRVEAIRAQIANGTYEIDSERLAESLIRENPNLFEELE